MALSQFPIVDTHDEEVMRETMVTRYGAQRFEASSSPDFFGRSAVAHLGAVSLVMCGYGASAMAEFPEAGFVRLQLAFSGDARTTIAGRSFEVNAARPCVIPAGLPCRIEFGSGYQQILIRAEENALERRLAALIGARPRGSIEFVQALENDHLNGLKNLIRFVASEMANSSVHLPHFLLEQFDELLLVALLKAVPNSFSEALHRNPREGTVSHVRLVEEYIDAHWQLPISVEHLANATGVGARTIFATFKRHRGYAPFAYLKMVRLKNARELLRSPTETTSVTNVALRCGFSNLGHFARDYRESFGELPSVTLARLEHRPKRELGS